MAYGVNSAWGLKPVKYLSGAPYTGMVRTYPIFDNYGTALFTGDPVISLADGSIGRAAAGDVCRGVFMGVKYRGTDGLWYHKPNWVANTRTLGASNAEAMIADDPSLVFDVQESSETGAAGTPLTLADVGLNINFYVGTGSTATGLSGVTIANNSEITTNTLSLKILELTPNETNKALGVTTSAGVAFANWLVCWNTHQLKGTTGSSGV